MKSSEVRQKYFDFFTKRDHKLIPSASLVPEDDPTTLFTSAGMQPILPYLLGKTHPEGKRIVDSQKSFRAQDIEEVGNNRHTTFFEMLGNWSFGDYWKEDQLSWLFKFLTDKDEGLGLDPQKLYVTAFKGNSQIPEDKESIEIWQKLFLEVGIEAKVGERIFLYGEDKNWWSRFGVPGKMPPGEPGGPDSEVFYEFTNIPHNPKYGEKCHPNCECGRFLEIANSVFMQYQKQEDGSFKELPNKNVDFGGGLERLVATKLDEADVFKNDLFWPIIEKIETQTERKYGSDEKTSSSMRVIADHLKAACFLIKDGVLPSNKMQGYVLRRLLRRASLKVNQLEQGSMDLLSELVDSVLEIYKDTDYFSVDDPQKIKQVVSEEVNKFHKTLTHGLIEIEKLSSIDGKTAFDLYQSYGFPFELLQELFSEKGQTINKEEFDQEFKKHQELSRTQSKITSS